ncbi:dynein light chain 1, cytoplasmic [Asparagus officinalis]|uniref:dynein light chain 1, cytoplasmic n=1 Tax=Asparagus officinalis TaxID=4686 RepID=UPI00098E3473|nr:dynein light chain 1, cytoplasmic [Asparagus officinalis]
MAIDAYIIYVICSLCAEDIEIIGLLQKTTGFTTLHEMRMKTLKVPKLSSGDDRKAAAVAGATANKKVILKSADMKEEMQKEAIDCALAAFENNGVEKEIAEYIKKEFDKKHGPTWHCIVGRNFGSYVTHETNHFIYFYLDTKAILLFKSG